MFLLFFFFFFCLLAFFFFFPVTFMEKPVHFPLFVDVDFWWRVRGYKVQSPVLELSLEHITRREILDVKAKWGCDRRTAKFQSCFPRRRARSPATTSRLVLWLHDQMQRECHLVESRVCLFILGALENGAVSWRENPVCPFESETGVRPSQKMP